MKLSEFERCFFSNQFILTEGAIVERVKSEFSIAIDPDVGIAGLIYDENGRQVLEKIYREYIQIAKEYSLPIMLMTNTRRCNKERVEQSKFSRHEIINDYALFLHSLASKSQAQVFVGGLLGCRGDAYSADESIGYENSLIFHKWQIKKFEETNLDFLFAGILPTLSEASGIAQLMSQTSFPYIISFMVNEFGTLLDGTSIHDAISKIDNDVSRPPLCYMANCIHPNILNKALSIQLNQIDDTVKKRFLGLQANASQLHPSLLNNSNELYTSSDVSLYNSIRYLHQKHPLKIYGGCCGTDQSHLRLIAKGMVNNFL